MCVYIHSLYKKIKMKKTKYYHSRRVSSPIKMKKTKYYHSRGVSSPNNYFLSILLIGTIFFVWLILSIVVGYIYNFVGYIYNIMESQIMKL